jgi:hypothetical protein
MLAAYPTVPSLHCAVIAAPAALAWALVLHGPCEQRLSRAPRPAPLAGAAFLTAMFIAPVRLLLWLLPPTAAIGAWLQDSCTCRGLCGANPVTDAAPTALLPMQHISSAPYVASTHPPGSCAARLHRAAHALWLAATPVPHQEGPPATCPDQK